jgi:hypothetical protein
MFIYHLLTNLRGGLNNKIKSIKHILIIEKEDHRCVIQLINGFRFPCYGDGLEGGYMPSIRLGSCLLGLFWMYNAISVVIFHFSWKMRLDVWGLG